MKDPEEQWQNCINKHGVLGGKTENGILEEYILYLYILW